MQCGINTIEGVPLNQLPFLNKIKTNVGVAFENAMHGFDGKNL